MPFDKKGLKYFHVQTYSVGLTMCDIVQFINVTN